MTHVFAKQIAIVNLRWFFLFRNAVTEASQREKWRNLLFFTLQTKVIFSMFYLLDIFLNHLERVCGRLTTFDRRKIPDAIVFSCLNNPVSQLLVLAYYFSFTIRV